MDTTITGIGGVVVAGLGSAGYMESTIGQYEKSIRALSGYAGGLGTSIYTPALGAGFASLTTSPRTGRFSAQRRFDYRLTGDGFDSYLVTGRVDLSVRQRGGVGPKSAGDQFVALDVSWEAEMADRGLAAATREAYGRMARGYLCFLESGGIFDVDAADAVTVLSFLASLSPRWATTSLFWVVSNFRPFLAFNRPRHLVDAVNLAGAKRSHPIVPILDDNDQRLVVTACASDVVCARDAAITLLALSTGLRACDIVDLRMSTGEGRRSPWCSARRATR